MIAIEDVENHVLSNTNEKMISCLRLSGFHTFVDYTIFNETTVNWIEKYIGIRCSLMTLDERRFYIDDHFIESPETFMFQVPLRHRLLKSVFELQRESERLMENIRNATITNVEDKPLSPLDESDNLEDVSDTISVNLPNDVIKSEPYLESSISNSEKNSMQSNYEINRKFYDDIIQFASEEFIECYLVPDIDFTLTLPDFNSENFRPVGRYHCLICKFKKRSNLMFKFRADNKIQFTKIKKHLSEHFTINPDASEIRKQNRLVKRVNRTNKRKHSINNDCELPTDMVIASKHIIPTKVFIPNNRKKFVNLFNEILPSNNQFVLPIKTEDLIQSDCPAELIPPNISEVKKFDVQEQNESIYETQISEPIDTVEVVIDPSITNDNQNFTEFSLSDSDIEESSLTICL